MSIQSRVRRSWSSTAVGISPGGGWPYRSWFRPRSPCPAALYSAAHGRVPGGIRGFPAGAYRRAAGAGLRRAAHRRVSAVPAGALGPTSHDPAADQAALQGLLQETRDLDLPLISVTFLGPGPVTFPVAGLGVTRSRPLPVLIVDRRPGWGIRTH